MVEQKCGQDLGLEGLWAGQEVLQAGQEEVAEHFERMGVVARFAVVVVGAVVAG
jgi:hypothetical protein